jgi:hypothetical protein
MVKNGKQVNRKKRKRKIYCSDSHHCYQCLLQIHKKEQETTEEQIVETVYGFYQWVRGNCPQVRAHLSCSKDDIRTIKVFKN